LGLEERRKRERENRKNAILKAARKLFFEKRYYNSKEEIYSQILLNDIDKFHEHIADILQTPASAAEALIRLAEIYIDFFLNDRELFRILMNFMLHNNDMNLPEDLNHHIIKTTNRTISIVEQVLRYGIDRGEFPPDINLRLNRNAIWGLLNGIISLHLFTGTETRRAEMIHGTVKSALEIYIRGLAIASR